MIKPDIDDKNPDSHQIEAKFNKVLRLSFNCVLNKLN